jgi:hypothetical protein
MDVVSHLKMGCVLKSVALPILLKSLLAYIKNVERNKMTSACAHRHSDLKLFPYSAQMRTYKAIDIIDALAYAAF